MKFPLLLGSFALAISAATASATTYNGNGGTGFGGQIGSGVLTITSNTTAGTFTVTENPNYAGNTTAGFSNALVLYIDSVPTTGFSDTSTFMDNGDNLRIATSGYDLNNPSNNNVTTQSIVTFATGFKADFAISMDAGNINLYSLASGTNNSLGFLQNAAVAGTANQVPSITFSASLLGVTASQGFKFVGTQISETAFRSNEAIADSTSGAAIAAAGSPGFNTGVTFSGFDTFGTPAAAPEPGTYVCMGIGAAALLVLNRRRARRA